MRQAFADLMISEWNQKNVFFLTGDLGFMALEGVRSCFQERFINAGVAEQNMVGVAAGLAREGFKVFVYSIAPFCYARPCEQIRNDLVMNHLPVCLVANGGGYAYGSMGPTHHALEDCAIMSALGVEVIVPAFDSDLSSALRDWQGPTYLRLGHEEKPHHQSIPIYAPWRQLLSGAQGVFAALGPMAGLAWGALQDLPSAHRPSLWAVSELDMGKIPDEFCQQVKDSVLYIAEEHVKVGGLGMQLLLELLQRGCAPKTVLHRHARGYPSGRFGSQAFHRKECELDAEGIKRMILQRS